MNMDRKRRNPTDTLMWGFVDGTHATPHPRWLVATFRMTELPSQVYLAAKKPSFRPTPFPTFISLFRSPPPNNQVYMAS